MKITFLGSSSCRFDAGDDTVHYLIDDTILIDTGWFVVAHLRKLGIEPSSLKGVLFTHLHHDHYLGLPGLLFSLYSDGGSHQPAIHGPAQDIHTVITRAEAFLQKERFFADAPAPEVIGFPDRGELTLGNVTIRYMPALHPVDARSFVIASEDGARIGISGDTAYNELGPAFYEGCDLLVHEASFGPRETTSTNNSSLHSSAADAARTARDAGVKHLILVHGGAKGREASVDAAAAIFKGSVSWPEPGQVISVS